MQLSEHELDIISSTRAKVSGDKTLTGENLFLVWGYPTAIILMLEFVALWLWQSAWCYWLWVLIPIIGSPTMLYFLHKDHARTHHTTLNESIILQMWIFIGCACFIGGLTTGIVGFFDRFFLTLLGLLCSMGCFMTGVILRFRPKVLCGIVAALLSFIPLFLQGDLWLWQLPVTALVITIALIIPGHLFRQFVKKHAV